VEYVNTKSDTSNYGSNWNRVTVIQEMPEQHTGTVRNQGTTGNGRIGHCVHTSENTVAHVQNTFNVRNNITCSKDCNYRTAATLYALETWFVSGM
jgi:hypothetical protein